MNLSRLEKELVAEIKFDEAIIEIIKSEVPKGEFQKLDSLEEIFLLDEIDNIDDFLPKYYSEYSIDESGTGTILVKGLSLSIPYLQVEKIAILKKRLAAEGYLLFTEKLFITPLGILCATLFPKSWKHETEIFKGNDPFDILKIKQTNGLPYDTFLKMIEKKL